jgi:hypothetical protein
MDLLQGGMNASEAVTSRTTCGACGFNGLSAANARMIVMLYERAE